ncbi:MAG: protease modulator HflC [Candidatus Aquirickettsiella sp.]
MLGKKIHLLLGFLVCLLFILYQSATIVPEGHTGLLLSAEKLTHNIQKPNAVLSPGLHFTLPFFMRPILLDNRLQTLVFSQASAESNSQEKLITIDYFANWRISDPIRYYQQTKNNFQQIKLLINQEITTLFNDKKIPIPLNQLILHGSSSLQLDSVLSIANNQLKTAGIKLTNIGFKQLHLSTAANTRLLNSMSTEQENNAMAQRAEGKAKAEWIRANADNSVSLILAKAKEKAAQIRAQGDAEAAKIYNQAYTKNPEFAAFYLNLQAYQQGFSNLQ